MKPLRRPSGILLFLCAAVILSGCAAHRDRLTRVDILLEGGRVVDGTGAPAFDADVAIAGGRIVAVGANLSHQADERIDARGLVIAPGFIDVHTHVENVGEFPLAENYTRQGVTTVVSGNCGSSALPLGAALASLEETGLALNYASLVGHNSVRREVMGVADRPPTRAELAQMMELVREALRSGAVGLSSGLQYVPGTYSDTAELQALASAAAEVSPHCVYASHMRNEGTTIEAAIAEALAIGEASGCRVQVSHLKLDSQSRWGDASVALSMLDEAAARGLTVHADQYAYTAGSSGIGIRFPDWALEGDFEAVKARLDDPAQWARIRGDMKQLLAERGFADLSWAVVANFSADPSMNGRALDEIAASTKGAGDLDAQLEVARDLLRSGGASIVYHFMSEEDVTEIMGHPLVGVASDGSVGAFGEGVPHPRMYGNNPRVLGEYVRDRGVLALEEAVRKMTSIPSEQFGFEERGQIAVGRIADLVLFDPETVGSPATFAEPHAYPIGIPHVFVHGTPVVRDGEPTGARPGLVLRGDGTAAPAIYP